MKICFFSPIYPIISDPRLGIFVHEQAKYLVKKGHKVYVITLGYREDKAYEVRDEVKIYRVRINKTSPFKNLFLILSVSKKLIILNKKYNFEIVNAHFVGRLVLLIGIITRLIKKPLVITAYGIGLLTNSGLKGLMTRIYLNFSEKIVCVSKYVGNLVAQHANKNKIVVINLGVDVEKLKPTKSVLTFKRELGLKNEKVILSVAGLVPRKGIDMILSSLPSVIKFFPDLKYFIIGKGAEKENLKKLAKELGLEPYVVFIGYTNELANFYNICDVFVLMSRTIKEKEGIEGLGMVYMEASYMGKPVIAGKSGGTADAVIDGVTGYRVEPTNQKELSNKIILLLKNDSLRKKLGNNGKKYIRAKLLWNHNADKLTKLYSEVLNTKKA